MPDLPEYMLTKANPTIDSFASDERLFRRVPNNLWDDDEVELDAIAFPDMSCTRELLGPPTAARWEGKTYLEWGVIGFEVGDIPDEVPYQGAFRYYFVATHAPNKQNYPHSEVRVYESPWDQPSVKRHITKQSIPGVPREAQLEWRELLRRNCRIVLRPKEEPLGGE